ncbi:MAG TPA: alpha/beta fold hydrolase [Candidatus Limnocylindrales bacterium]
MTTADGELTVPVPGGHLWAEVAGSGSGVVLAHAGIADARMWDPQWDALSARHRVARYDLRGFRRSEVEHVRFSNREDLIAVMDAAGLDRAVLVGCSRAATISLDTALEFPDRVRGLVWVCGGVSGADFGDAGDEIAELDRREEALAEAKDWEGVTEIDLRIWVDGPREPAGSGPAAVRELVRTMCLDTLRQDKVYGDQVDLVPPAVERLGDLRVPVLAIVGERDPLVTARAADVLVAGVTGARRIDLPGVAHLPNLERPEWFTETLLAFLAENDAAARDA